MGKAKRKPRPSMPDWFWWGQDGCWFCKQGLLVGYCSWDGDKLIPADGDYYSVDEVISKYEYEENGSLTYWTVSEWM